MHIQMRSQGDKNSARACFSQTCFCIVLRLVFYKMASDDKYHVPLKETPEGFHGIRNQLVSSKLNTTHKTNACSKLTKRVPLEIN